MCKTCYFGVLVLGQGLLLRVTSVTGLDMGMECILGTELKYGEWFSWNLLYLMKCALISPFGMRITSVEIPVEFWYHLSILGLVLLLWLLLKDQVLPPPSHPTYTRGLFLLALERDKFFMIYLYFILANVWEHKCILLAFHKKGGELGKTDGLGEREDGILHFPILKGQLLMLLFSVALNFGAILRTWCNYAVDGFIYI